ncbi:ABC transporter ATP-binding protein [Duganella sp. Leaf126]|uniref:amino acid ABC transporter ATP-binding/permease protein n=1 Tax=Duganella sp. Leaf126 TaxID=1736266 RepID=UPI000701F053|nr:ATP-binding cassette domain-containing protein [Duganella sp. Leaf126]KQQ36261.1 ABC transporter ATP-binding protein [Duganella sp. Leaf126]
MNLISDPALRQLLLAEPKRLLGGAALAALTTLAGMALLGLSGWFITATAIAGASAATALMFDVFAPSAGIRLLALGRTGSRYAERLVTHDATFGALARLRVQLFRGWSLPDASSRLLRSPARLLFRLTADIDALESLYLRLLVPAATAVCAALLAGVTLGVMQWQLGVAVGLWLLLCGSAITALLMSSALRPGLARARAVEALRARAIDLVAGQTELAMAGRLGAQCHALQSADRALARADLALMRCDTRAGAAFGIAGSITLAAVLLAAAALTDLRAMPVPLAALAILLALAAMEPFAGLRRGALEAGRLWLAIKRLGPKLAQDSAPQPAVRGDDADPDTGSGTCTCTNAGTGTGTDIGVVPAADAAGGPVKPAATVIALDRASAAQGGAAPRIHHIDLHIAPGERVALVGPSGAGKSTLLALIAGEIAPLAGSVASPSACLFTQRTELFQDTVRDNLRLASPAADDAGLWLALQMAGLDAQVRAFSQGLDTMLGEGGLGLSGGQARRLALARLLLHRSRIWLLDEATEALDAATARDVLQRLDAQARAGGQTLVIATHLRREAALADRLVGMRNGRIAFDARRGTPQFETALAALRQD